MARPKTRTITIQDALQYLSGLNQLNSYARVIKSGEGAETVVQVPFSFSAEALLAIAINTSRLTTTQKDYQDASGKLFRSISGGASEMKPPTPFKPDDGPDAEAKYQSEMAAHQMRIAKFQEGEQDLRKSKVSVEIRPIPIAGLRLGENPIQPTVLAAVEPLIDWQEADETPAEPEKKKVAA